MGAEDEMRARRGAGPLPQNVARAIDADVLQPQRLERLTERLCAAAFLERRGRYLAKSNLLVEKLRLRALQSIDCGLHRRLSQQLTSNIRRGVLPRNASTLMGVEQSDNRKRDEKDTGHRQYRNR